MTTTRRRPSTATERKRKREYMREWSRKNPEKLRAINFKRTTAGRHGGTIAGFELLLAQQDGKCAICGRLSEDSRNGHLDQDHCHETDRLRGLLCSQCNTALGLMADEPERLRAAALYLEKWIR